MDEIKQKFDVFYASLNPIDKLYFGHYLIDRFIKDMENDTKSFYEKNQKIEKNN